MGEIRNAFRILVRKPEMKDQLGEAVCKHSNEPLFLNRQKISLTECSILASQQGLYSIEEVRIMTIP